MTFLTERLADLRKHLDHLVELRPRVIGPESLRGDLSLHNDVLFSLLTIAQLVIDISGELSTRRGLAFSDYTEAVRNLAHYQEFSDDLVDSLARLPGFRNVLLHEYVDLDYSMAVEALGNLQPVYAFLEITARFESEG
jgi:uncharacterized protein YutE (UPF0331/DUF86 family)